MVIQRWQSVLLFIAAVAMFIFTFLSLGQVQLPEYSLNFTTLGFCIEGQPAAGQPSGFYMHTWLFFIVSIMCGVLPLINIFLFRNLILQKKICLIEILFLLACISIGCGYGYCSFNGYSVSWSSLIVAPGIALVATLMAYARIRADQRLLKSADRIR